MTLTFDLRKSLVVVPVFVAGPEGGQNFDFAVDTGASRSSLNGLFLEALGYRQDQTRGHRLVRTGSGGLAAGSIAVSRFSAFGIVRVEFPLLWLPIPPSTRIDGLLGLDFLRGHILTTDFVRGRISLNLPRRWWHFW